jgi:hypothetical protein
MASVMQRMIADLVSEINTVSPNNCAELMDR